MNALLAQLVPSPGDAWANAQRASALLDKHPEADLAVFPELYLSGYELRPSVELARDSQTALRLVAERAAVNRTAVVIGLAEERPGGIANAAVVIAEDGSLAGTYRKMHLFGRERGGYLAGDRLLVASVAGTAVAPLVCFDVEFPEPARALARAGAELLVTVSANMAPYAADHALLARARALENRLPHIYVNRVGAEASFRFVGGSCVIGTDGTIVAELSPDGEDVRIAEVPFRRPEEVVDYLRQLAGDYPVDKPEPTPTRVGGRA
jgi:predicted amidohydrolase